MNATAEAVNTWLATKCWLDSVAKTETARKALGVANTTYRAAADACFAANAAKIAADKACAAADTDYHAAIVDEVIALATVRNAWVAENGEVREGSYED